MKNRITKYICLITLFVFLLSVLPAGVSAETVQPFSDVTKGFWAENYINSLHELGITNGIGNNKFGVGLSIKRSEFVSYLVRLMKWQLYKPAAGSFTDNQNTGAWYYSYIETALKNGAITKSATFRPDASITREEMAVMLVRALGYETLATQLSGIANTFTDVTKNTNYIAMAQDFGIITGVGNNLFKPASTAKREEAAAMMIRMYDKLNKPVSELNGFYAISSYSQIDKISSLDSAGFGWSRLAYNQDTGLVGLNTTSSNDNEYSIPKGFTEPLDTATRSNAGKLLMVYASNETISGTGAGTGIPMLEYVLTRSDIRSQVTSAIAAQVNNTVKDNTSVSFDGVVVDFEGMKGATLKGSFNTFLAELNKELDKSSKKLYVAVHPKARPGLAYYDAYDFRAIGDIADRVILMAHDYYAKSLTDSEMQSGYTNTPLTPIADIYYALKAITDKDTGVRDTAKILLQLSFDSVQWKLKDGKVVNKYPIKPSYDDIRQRLLTDVTINYGNSKNPNIKFYDSSDDTQNVVWYEDSRSVLAKIELAGMFGIKGISLWRLGIIPDYPEPDAKKIYLDIWQQILNRM